MSARANADGYLLLAGREPANAHFVNFVFCFSFLIGCFKVSNISSFRFLFRFQNLFAHDLVEVDEVNKLIFEHGIANNRLSPGAY